MSFTYEQSTGRLYDKDSKLVATGYSGAGIGKNNSLLQDVHDVGPIPQGTYSIQPPQFTYTHGPYVLPLIPSSTNEMFGRSGFLCHGDSVVNPGTASEGCIIMPRQVRQTLWGSSDHTIEVVRQITANEPTQQLQSA